MANPQWTIYWNEYNAGTFLYGAEITYHKRNFIEYRSELLPVGAVIKTWYSHTNYQMQRIEPSLPIIDGESEYEVSIDIDYPKGGKCLLRFVFLDKYEEEAGYALIREKKDTFRCPLKTHSYRMELMNVGVTEFHFHSVKIKEVGQKNG